MVGLTVEQQGAARVWDGGGERNNLLLEVSQAILQNNGHVPDALFRRAREAGIDDGQLLELVANVALHTLTNYSMRLAQTEIDFPQAPVLRS